MPTKTLSSNCERMERETARHNNGDSQLIEGKPVMEETTDKARLGPPPESKESRRVRLKVVLSYWIVILLLGIPLWIRTTSIYRAPLPYERMEELEKNTASWIHIRLPIYLKADSSYNKTNIASLAQQKLYTKLPAHLFLIELIPSNDDSAAYTPDQYLLEIQDGQEDGYQFSNSTRQITINCGPNTKASTESIADYVTRVLTEKAFASEIAFFSNPSENSDTVAYSPVRHLTFSLVYEGGDPLTWDIEEALARYFTPLQKQLSRVSNLAIDSQILFFSSLAFDPPLSKDGETYVLGQEELSMFINFAEWSLSSFQTSPTLNFILYVPKAGSLPLKVLDSEENAFWIPQYGGVKVLNIEEQHWKLSQEDLLPVIEVFSNQLLELLGVAHQPPSFIFRIDSLSRISTYKTLVGASSTLGSLYRLSHSLSKIAIPQSVGRAVQSTIQSLEKGIHDLNSGDWDGALKNAGNALRESEKAFFEKMMVQQVFFPDEHKVAVYLPLIGPVSVPLILYLLRILKESRIK